MTITTEKLNKIVIDALFQAHNVLLSLKTQRIERIVDNTSGHDITTSADITISKTLIEYFRATKIPAILFSEESGKKCFSERPRFLITIDELDGTGNYYRGRDTLPFCTAVTIFDSTTPTFSNAIAAGIIEHKSGYIWTAGRKKGCFLNDQPVRVSGSGTLDRDTLIIIDHYASSGEIHKLKDLYTVSWVKDFGSAALHLAGISSGIFDAYISSAQKAHELGAGFLIILEAGGCITNFSGASIANLHYYFDKTYDIIATAIPRINESIIMKLKNKG